MKPSSTITNPSRSNDSTWASVRSAVGRVCMASVASRRVPSLADQPYARLLEEVAAATPAPGGGSSSALAAALGAALVEMASRLAIAREAESVPPEIPERAGALRARALELADRELGSYAPVLEARRLPADDPSRDERVRAALAEASGPPLEIAETAAEVSELAATVAAASTPSVRGDALAGGLLAAASADAAASLVEINLAEAGDAPELGRARAARERSRAATAALGAG